jgi:hypothetical protein
LSVSSPGSFTPENNVPGARYRGDWEGHRVSLDAMKRRRLQTLMMGTEIVIETSVTFNQLTAHIPRRFYKEKKFLALKKI